MDNIYTYVVTLPDNIREMVTPCADGYTVYLSDRLDSVQMLKSFRHALNHIKNRDFETEKDITEMETKANVVSGNKVR